MATWFPNHPVHAARVHARERISATCVCEFRGVNSHRRKHYQESSLRFLICVFPDRDIWFRRHAGFLTASGSLPRATPVSNPSSTTVARRNLRDFTGRSYVPWYEPSPNVIFHFSLIFLLFSPLSFLLILSLNPPTNDLIGRSKLLCRYFFSLMSDDLISLRSVFFLTLWQWFDLAQVSKIVSKLKSWKGLKDCKIYISEVCKFVQVFIHLFIVYSSQNLIISIILVVPVSINN